jgi:hypothetical protein
MVRFCAWIFGALSGLLAFGGLSMAQKARIPAPVFSPSAPVV